MSERNERRRSGRTFAVIAGGGTAGHVLPGLAIADALVARGHDPSSIHFVGATRGMEATMVPEAGYEVTLLAVEGVRRSVSAANLRPAARFATALPASVRLLRRLRPSVVVSVGGYASVPAVLASAMLRIPVVVVSYDAVPGAAARLEARLAAINAVAFEGSGLPRQVVTGAPVRQSILAVDVERDRLPARAAVGLPADRFTILAFGGSLGSARLNEVIVQYAARRSDRVDLAVRHVVGRRHEATAAPSVERPDGLWYQVVRYEERMHLAYAAADLVVARAGATTVAELAALGRPSILVPWPLATQDHQTANARVLAGAGGAVLLPESELDAARLDAEVDRLVRDPVLLAEMAERARGAGRRDAAERIAELADQHARVLR